MRTAATSPDQALLDAQQRALASDQRIVGLVLDPVSRRLPASVSLDVAQAIIAATATLTMEGASSVDISLQDPDWDIEASGLTDRRDDGHLPDIDITLDGIGYRLADLDRQGEILKIVFEDRAVALLRRYTEPLIASRDSTTRAKFIEKMVREVKSIPIGFYAPEKGRKQHVERIDYPAAAPSRNETGFDPGTRLKLRQWDGSETVLDARQMGNAATAMRVADQQDAGPKSTLALIEACIVEAPMFANPEGGEGSSAGILQLTDAHLGGSTSTRGGRRDVELVCRLFLTQGFTGRGGAIELARKHPEWDAGQVAQAVQGSAFPERYRAVSDSAKRVVSAYSRGDQSGADSDVVLRVKSFQFMRGDGGKRESTWKAANRLAEEVAWRFFIAGGVASFISDDRLLMNTASIVLDSPFDAGLLEPPDYNAEEHTLTLRAVVDRFAARPGDVVALLGNRFGSVKGRWLIHTVEYNLLDAADTTITLVKPVPPRPEPAPEVSEQDVKADTSDAPSGAKRAVAWARLKIGHFKEELGNNSGAELDALERGFHFQGAPWCAIFATTAVSKGAGDSVKTAAVAQIRQWAGEGSHGFQRGFRATPKPGDLMLFGNDHVALVEKVDGDSVTTIEGNTSANKVARLTRLTSSGDFARPEYT